MLLFTSARQIIESRLSYCQKNAALHNLTVSQEFSALMALRVTDFFQLRDIYSHMYSYFYQHSL